MLPSCRPGEVNPSLVTAMRGKCNDTSEVQGGPAVVCLLCAFSLFFPFEACLGARERATQTHKPRHCLLWPSGAQSKQRLGQAGWRCLTPPDGMPRVPVVRVFGMRDTYPCQAAC